MTEIKKLTLHKAPGLNGISPNAIRALDSDNIQILFDICYKFFNDEISIQDWQIGNLKILPKKGDLSNTNNWRGINLLDVTSKVISIIITSRLQSALSIDGIPFQFGSSPNTGCPDGSYSIKSILQLNKEHDLNIWVVFVDLVKAFDTIHHELMFKLLGKFGIPKYLIRVIEKLYHEFQIEIKVVKCKERIDYQTGVKQGDNFAHILFIIVMQFIYELVE